MRPARMIMFMGTGSDVGKSMLVAGLCRYFTNQGLRVAPFKPQNMSNNAAVTADGGEIGRAQALHALASKKATSVHMNPVLLKPQSGTGSQIIVQGKIAGNAEARAYQSIKAGLMPKVLESLSILRADTDLVIVEGAGSAAEINLRHNDIANMGFARAAECPVVLIGDIDRGGVIASVVGVKHVLDAEDSVLIKGFIINKMRGDATLFDDGMRFIAERTGWQPLGLVPFFDQARALPQEDVLGLSTGVKRAGAKLKIAVLALPRISNFDDIDPLLAEPDINVAVLRPNEPIAGDCDLVVLPGSKATMADLAVLRSVGWDIDLAAHYRRGGRILGLCGGFQMLGMMLHDPQGIEGVPQSMKGLGFLDIETTMTGNKQLTETHGQSALFATPVSGYEMHVGQSSGPHMARPFAILDNGKPDGAVSPDQRIIGTYLHGIFHKPAFRAAFLTALGAGSTGHDQHERIDTVLDALANHLAQNCNCEAIATLAGL
jgi:adenosylcobyric acid synthase